MSNAGGKFGRFLMSASLQAFQAKTAQFLEWFRSGGGTLHEAVGIDYFEGTGRGAIALDDIPVCTICPPVVG
jgi:hypothetical protein